MSQNLMVYQFNNTMELFLSKFDKLIPDGLSKKNLYGFDTWSNNRVIIINNEADLPLPNELIRDIQAGLCEYFVRVNSAEIFKHRPEYALLYNHLYAIRVNDIYTQYYGLEITNKSIQAEKKP